MNSKALKNVAIWELKANLVMWSINIILIAVLVFVLGFSQSFETSLLISKLTFLECGIIFVVGGIVAFSGSVFASKTRNLMLRGNEHWSINTLRAKEKNANKFLILAIIFFLESLVLAFSGF